MNTNVLLRNFIRLLIVHEDYFKKFRYEIYASFRLYKKDQLEIINIPFLEEVFNLYHSGQSSNKKSFVRFYFLLAILVFMFLLLYFYFIVMSMFEVEKPYYENIPANEKIYAPASEQPKNSNLFYDDKNPKSNNIDLPEIYVYNISCLMIIAILTTITAYIHFH